MQQPLEEEDSQHPFKMYGEAIKWNLQFVPANCGIMKRFQFLVIPGDSGFGKSQWACSPPTLRAPKSIGTTTPASPKIDRKVDTGTARFKEPSFWKHELPSNL